MSSVAVFASHCGPCVDVALASATTTEAIKAAKQMPSPAAAMPIAALQPRNPTLRARIGYPHESRFDSEKAHTVVIRC